MPANKLKEKGKKFVFRLGKAVCISRSPSPGPSRTAPNPEPPLVSQPAPTAPINETLPSSGTSAELAVVPIRQSEDVKGVSETQKQDDHAAIAADDSQSAPHAVSVWHSLELSASFRPYIRVLIFRIAGYGSLYQCTPSREPERCEYWTGAVPYAKGSVCSQECCVWIEACATSDEGSFGCIPPAEIRGLRDSRSLESL